MDKIIYGADTETCEGAPFCMQFYSEDDGGECVDIIFFDAASALDRLIAWCKTCSRNRQHVVYVHNLDFDSISFLWPVKERMAGSTGEFDFMYKGWRIHGAHGSPTFFRVSNGHDKIILFVDSFSWIRSSLAKASDMFCPDLPKRTRPEGLGEKVFRPTDKAFCMYAMRDAEIAYHMGRAIEAVHQEFDISQCVSVADMAARIFRHQFVKDPLPLPDRDVLEGSLLAYHGGKNNFVGKPGWYQDVSALDISSAYPDAMHEFPHFTEAKAYRSVRIGRARRVPDLGVYLIRGRLTDCDWPILFSHGFKPLEAGLVEDVWVTGYELNEAIASGEFRLSSATGYIYDVSREKARGTPALRAYVDDFYQRKSDEKDKVKRYFYKLLLNSLSGKFIQTRKRAERDTIDEDDNYSGDSRLVAGGLFHPFIAALITGHTRARIHGLEHRYSAIHTATDGIITQKRIAKKELGSGLGSLTVEATGDALILRNKLYILYGDSGETPSAVFKGKRIVKYAMHGFQGHISELERMIVSGRRKYVKNKPNRLKESVKRGLIANKFEPHPYTLKVGDLLLRG